MPDRSPMPALFVGHGSPMTALQPDDTTQVWADLAQGFERPRAVVCISGHWETKGVLITAAEQPRTIHDFYGFPPPLYQMQYPAPGDPALARELESRLGAWGARADLDSWGLDHGAWTVLMYMYPEADVPVVQLSLDLRRTPAEHYAIGRELGALRDEGVLVLGSGNIVHNLRAVREAPSLHVPLPWTVEFDAKVSERVLAGQHAELIDYPSLGPASRLAAPEPDHYLPLLYVLATQRPGEQARRFNHRLFSAGAMTSFAIGYEGALAA